MYAVIRAGGKQYRVAPGDVIRVEKLGGGRDTIQFEDVLAVAGDQGQIGRPQSEARVTGQVVEDGRHDKVLVFHYKRKKQYKKLRGHRQPFTRVRITEIAYDGQTFSAPELPKREPEVKNAKAAEAEELVEARPAATQKKAAKSKRVAAKKAPKKK
jgi:large subunit ribosomal protein L21